MFGVTIKHKHTTCTANERGRRDRMSISNNSRTRFTAYCRSSRSSLSCLLRWQQGKTHHARDQPERRKREQEKQKKH